MALGVTGRAAWHTPSVSHPPPPPMRTPGRWLMLAGMAGLLLGTGPLIAVIVAARMGWTADPNPNPIGPGILAFFSFWPSIAALVAGLALWLGSRRG
jgi:hypothetical protein